MPEAPTGDAPRQHAAAWATPEGIVVAGGEWEGQAKDDITMLRPGEAPRRLGTLPRPASRMAVAPVEGGAFLAGGRDGATPLDAVLRAEGGEVREVARLPRPLASAAAAVANGTLYVAGGVANGEPTDEMLAIRDGAVRVLDARLPSPRFGVAALATPHGVLLAGGQDAEGNLLADVLWLDPATETLRSAAARLPAHEADPGRAYAAAAWTGELVLVAGGRSLEAGWPRVVAVDPATDAAWDTQHRLDPPREGASLVPWNGRVWLVGGSAAGSAAWLDAGLVYDLRPEGESLMLRWWGRSPTGYRVVDRASGDTLAELPAEATSWRVPPGVEAERLAVEPATAQRAPGAPALVALLLAALARRRLTGACA